MTNEYQNFHFGINDQYTLIDFWGSWCGPCIAAIPQLVKLNSLYQGKLNIVGVAYKTETSGDKAKAVVVKNKIHWPTILQTERNVFVGADIIRTYKIQAYPTYVLLDQEGIILIRTHKLEEVEVYLKRH